MKFKQWWDKNKVFVMGLLGAIAFATQQYLNVPDEELKWKTIGFAALIAVMSYIGNKLRGQAMTMWGMLGNLLVAMATILESGQFSWGQLIFQVMIAAGFVALPDPKSRGYENTNTIRQAKIEGEKIMPAPLTNAEIKKAAGV